MLLQILTFALWYHSCHVMRLPSFFGDIWILPIWISIFIELIFSSSSWLITECQPEPSGWNPVGAVVSGASHYYAWIAKAVKDGFPCQRQLCYCLRSKVMIKTQVYVHVYENSNLQTWMPALCFLLDNIGSSSNASCAQTSICGKQKHKWL